MISRYINYLFHVYTKCIDFITNAFIDIINYYYIIFITNAFIDIINYYYIIEYIKWII